MAERAHERSTPPKDDVTETVLALLQQVETLTARVSELEDQYTAIRALSELARRVERLEEQDAAMVGGIPGAVGPALTALVGLLRTDAVLRRRVRRMLGQMQERTTRGPVTDVLDALTGGQHDLAEPLG